MEMKGDLTPDENQRIERVGDAEKIVSEDNELEAQLVDDEAEANRVLRKVDMRLVPMLALLYLVAFIDRSNIGNAKIAGMTKDLKMPDNTLQYNTAVTLFFVPYTLLEVPSNIVLKMMKPSYWMAILLLSWGTVMTLMGLVNNYSGLLAGRFFLGVTEAGFLKDVNYEDPDAPEDHLVTNINLAHSKLAAYYAEFDDAPVYYTATVLHPHYKHHLSALWKVPDNHIAARDGVHYRDGWLNNNHRAFLRMWQGRKDAAAIPARTVTPPRKKPQLGLSTSRSAFLQLSIKHSIQQVEASLAEDEYKIWKQQPALAEEDWLSLNPLLYWESVTGQFPILLKFAINVLTIPAAAADCERTFSELGDMLGTRRLHMKPELVSALQSLKSWKRVGIQPVTTSGSSLACTLSEEEVSKIQEQLSQFNVS
ncbi:MFS general substrate transporter [Plenodomus tracheiphilus IPT5]|uniref:MFS general substrate transporter n=1 Tax=Plenodomus tracheiphilus IPT5 TaxID=1408161 RepID=A0A6A7B1V0_9PLEO|nr:MFS general substrate transporter [Plenodomus tracheiphilus IPT5]